MTKNNLPPVKVAVLIDGGFFIKRFNAIYNKTKTMTGEEVANELYTIAHKHVGRENTLYRIFYYDCHPFDKKMHNPIDKHIIDFKKTPEYIFRASLIDTLKRKRKVALRLGELKDNKSWSIYPHKIKELLNGNIEIKDLTPDDVFVELRQKGIDMKIGVDIASMALKKFVDRIILISGDADFVPAAKLARREGIDFILDPMGANIENTLFEHIDGLDNSVSLAHSKKKTTQTHNSTSTIRKQHTI